MALLPRGGREPSGVGVDSSVLRLSACGRPASPSIRPVSRIGNFAMMLLLLTAVLSTVVSEQNEPQTYAVAYRVAQEEGKPLVVVIGADWCPACVNLKQTTLAQLKTSGGDQEYSIAEIDRDAQPGLARKLMRGNTIPQIIVFAPGQSGWKRSQLTGFQPLSRVRSLIRQTSSGT
jgi:thiol:disulfide interchange protein